MIDMKIKNIFKILLYFYDIIIYYNFNILNDKIIFITILLNIISLIMCVYKLFHIMTLIIIVRRLSLILIISLITSFIYQNQIKGLCMGLLIENVIDYTSDLTLNGVKFIYERKRLKK